MSTSYTTSTDMNEALCSILCEQPLWSFNPYFNEHIIFNNDGTGELWCVVDMTYIFAVNLQWRSILPDTKAESKVQEPTHQTLGTLHLEITLHTSVAKSYPAAHIPGWASPNEHYLSKAAFKPRCFTVTVEKGRFIPDTYIGTVDMQHNPQWGLRLVFDKSPYPAQEGLAHPANSYDCSNRFDSMTRCVARELKQAEKKGRRAMNDPTYTFWDFVRPVRRILGLEPEEFHMCGTCTPVFGIGFGEGQEGRRARRECPNR